jgi:rhodanese-related sulfurtransferase
MTMSHLLNAWPTLGLLAVVLTACTPPTDGPKPDANAEIISVAELAERIRLDRAPLIVDVRSEQEYAEAHIPGAVNIPHDQLGDRLAEIDAAKSDEIVVLCRSGRRAEVAEKLLIDAGYSRIYDLDGHMNAWQSGGYPTDESQCC